MVAEQIFNGIVLGSMYALIALGYTLVFGVLDKLNFTHSEIFMAGGFVLVSALGLGAPLWATLPIVFVVCGVLGLVVEFVSFRRFKTSDAQVTAALSSLALGLIVIDVVQKTFGADPVAVDLPSAIRTAGFELYGFRLAWIKLATLAITLLLMLALHLVMTRTAIGRNIRAVAESPIYASLLGVNVRRVNQQTFFIASALAGAAGLLLALRTGLASSDIGLSFGLKALAIMAIGGMGDLRGAVAGGILVGVVEALTVQFGLGKLGDTAVWIVMIFVLLVRPAGLFSRGSAHDVRA